ncbi:glycoside hydrolase family 5 protein [Fibrobacter sp.]|uniref:glycoside hydrolase family 5 protein n=1 Tax=Fibrobacter sp. TaxID=35828 RepID=UPI0025C1A6B1|nr:glycoside hydrolase family 5 protein [Fibrobacter sp.]MBR3071639.1 glycoside hydrolase family 5 protein [Fibrobacter sp.]
MRFNTFGIAASSILLAAASAFALPKATEIFPKMGLGYNIGNTMEVPGNPTAWGNPFPDAAYVKAIKDAGFTTVRIPCAWNSHSSNGTINAGWLDSVKTVVDLVINNGMYAILNSHWDEGWLEDHVFDGEGYDKTGLVNSSAAAVAAKQESYWKQIATKFAEYDEHLIFASANEPGVNDPWNGGADNGQWAFDSKRMAVLKQFHEACIKAVRSTGGNNATRIVVVQSPRTEIDKAPLLSEQYPTDPAGDGYTMAEVHFYPYQFSLMTSGDEDWGKMFYYWEDKTPGNDAAHTCSGSALGSKTSIDNLFSGLKTRFFDKGIPVVIGEMGAVKRLDALSGDNLKKHLEARAAWYGYTVAAAKKNGLVPCVWDTGDEGNGNFTIIRRQVNKFGGKVGDITDVETLNAMREAYGQAALPGNTIDSTVKENTTILDGDMALHVSYKTVQSDTVEVGTIRINTSADWSKYVAVSFDMRVAGESAGPCNDTSRDGCNEYGWANVVVMNMSSSWTWNEVTLGDVSDFGTLKNHKIEFGDGAGQLAFKDASKMNAFGIIVRGTQFTGDMYLDNLLLWKADGTADTLQNFNTKKPDIEGIAKGKLIKANDKGDWGEDTKSGICMPRVIVTTKMQVSVQPGIVNAMFTANKASRATATLLNTMGQVIAQQSFTANAGMNKVQLSTNFRGPAVLIVKQGSQKNVQQIKLR